MQATIPLEPPFRPNDIAHVRLHDNSSRIRFPGSTKVRGRGVERGCKIRVGRDVTELDGEARGLVWVFATLSGYGILLIRQTLFGQNLAVLEHHAAIAEDEIDGATNPALSVKLTHGVCI